MVKKSTAYESEDVKGTKVKEIIKEKEVIVKVRCAYCKKLYDETENKCPYYSASR